MDHFELLNETKEKAWKQLEEIIRRGDMSERSIDMQYKLIKIIKNGGEAEMLEKYDEENESHTGGYGEMYDGGGSGARNGVRYVRRDGSRDSYEVGSTYKRNRYGRFSRDDGIDHIKRKMHEMLDIAPTEREREAIRRCIELLEEE